jgi:hypothetical protein
VDVTFGAEFHRVVHPMQGVPNAWEEAYAAAAENDTFWFNILYLGAKLDEIAYPRHASTGKIRVLAECPDFA